MKKVISKSLLIVLITVIAIPLLSVNAFSKPSNSLNKQSKKLIVAEDLYQDKKWQKGYDEFLRAEVGENYKELFERNTQSVEQADKIRDLFPWEDKSGEPDFSNYVGGLYINSDDYLVVQIVKKNIPKKGTEEYFRYQKVLSIPGDNLKVEYVKYSYVELKFVEKAILDYYKTNHSTETFAIYDRLVKPIKGFTLDDNVTAFYIDVINNKIGVEMLENTEKKASEFKNKLYNSVIKSKNAMQIDSETIEFKQGAKIVDEWNPGQATPDGLCSFAYRARVTSNPSNVGIMTAGHCPMATSVGYVYIAPNGNIFTTWSWQNSGSIDAAFMSTSSNTAITNILHRGYNQANPGSTLSTTVTTVTTGQRVGKIGQMAPYYSTGTIQNPSATIGSFTNMATANYSSTGGDSGGIVFAATSDTDIHTTAGIHKGTNTANGHKIFSKASIINQAFGLQRY